jgi:glycosyltransferase involved in cell wall biosynthesis
MERLDYYRQKFKTLKVCVIIPTYNNASTLGTVIDSVLSFTRDVFVINDGSTDETLKVLAKYPELSVLTYYPNKGKGWALRKGFEWTVKAGFDYAITIDSDGQHFAEDLPLFIDKLEEKGASIILGARNMAQEGVPGKSSFGHKFSNFWFWVETGVKAPDTQTGYRLYPVRLLNEMNFFTRKYEFEIEVLVRSSWKGISIESVPIKVYYSPKESRISHFRPFKDFTRISLLNTLLVIITLSYIIPRNFLRTLFSRSTYSKLADKIVESNQSKLHSSVSLAFGVFMGIIPIWGFQLLVAILLSVVFRLNKILVILSANISIPPMIPLIIYLSYKLGAFILGDSASQHMAFDQSITLDSVRNSFVQYVYGSILLAIIASVLTGLISFLLLFWFQEKSKE